MKAPQVAIITRTKDRPVFLKRAIHSVLGQTFSDWVHVIVNDGGDRVLVDDLVAVFSDAYADRVRVVHHDEPRGMQNASNSGLAAIDSVYVVIHDDDDSWYPDFLEKTVSCLDENGPHGRIQGVVTQTTQVTEEICLDGQIRLLKETPYYPFDYVNLGEMRRRNIFPPIAFLYRRVVHERVGTFRQEFDVLGDHDFNLRFLRFFDITVLPTPHARYHWRYGSHGNTVTRSRNLHRRMLNRMKNAYQRDALERSEKAVGDVDGIEFPPPDGGEILPFNLRTGEPPVIADFPDFQAGFDFDVLSLDVFDTVLRRRCHRPKDVFLMLEQRAVNELKLPARAYAIVREEAEAQARQEFQPEVTLAEIYKVAGKWLQLDPLDRDRLMELELRIEQEMLYADPRWLEFYQACRENQTRVIFLSDMYHDSGTIRKFLENCGFREPEVFVSCEFHLSKHDGTLQPEVSQRLGVEPGRILHVGDNFHSDCLRCWEAGWQAFHWSRDFNYTPWYAEVEPFQYNRGDLLSLRTIGEVERLGLLQPITEGEDRSRKLGREVAGPLYLFFMSWVVEQARRDGIRKLILLGRDGYYWEKALQLLEGKKSLGIEFSYLHSSRKVLNFASFKSLSEEAMEFLLTPNPSLRVRDFIDRTGLRAEDHVEIMEHVGFADPDQVLTKEMGGSYLKPQYGQRLRNMFLLLKLQLEELFTRDRAGMLKILEEVEYKPEDCALVDIGWNASCVRAVARLLEVEKPRLVRGYFFGTWSPAEPGELPVEVKSWFLHLEKPENHAQLVRESVNWIESLSAAPYSTLMDFAEGENGLEPRFSEKLRSGFSVEQQEALWQGAEEFIRSMLEGRLPAAGSEGGFAYLNLVLHRLLREPSPAELAEWGGMLHSEGFGLEIYKPLVEPVEPDMGREALMSAYRASNWKRGFLSSLPETQRDFIIERLKVRENRTAAELRADLDWKTRQADEYWTEKERLRWEAGQLRERNADMEKTINKLRGDLGYKIQQAEEFWKEKEQNLGQAKVMEKARDAYQARVRELDEEVNELKRELHKSMGALDWKIKQAEELWAEKEKETSQLKADHEQALNDLKSEMQQIADEKSGLDAELAQLTAFKSGLESDLAAAREAAEQAREQMAQFKAGTEAEMDRLQRRLAFLETLMRNRGQLMKILFSGRIPEDTSSMDT